jgi:hypothetical protein
LIDFEKSLRKRDKDYFTPQKEKQKKRPVTASESRVKSASKQSGIPIKSYVEKAAYLKHMDQLIEAV